MINSSCSFLVSCSSDNKELNSNPAFILPGYSHQESHSNGCLNGYLCPSPGFPYTQRCRLTNSSPVPLTFQLRMSDDGTQPALDSMDQIRRDTDLAWRKGIYFYVEPREFTMNPSQGTILPQGHQDIEVTLCSNTVMEFYQRMLVGLEGIGKGVATLIITARYELYPPKFKPQPPRGTRTSLDCPASQWRQFKIRNVEEPVTALKEVQDFSQSSGAEAFSILPLSGVLQPGESQQVSSTFSGHLSSTCSVPELCHVEGGPTSEVLVPGEASLLSSSLSPREINCGSQAPLRERRELKQLAQKLEEEAKPLEEEERRKEEKNGVSVGKQPPKLPEKGKTPREEGNQNPKKGNQGPREEGNQSIREEGKQTPREEAKQTPRKEKQTSRKEGNQIPREEGNQNPREGNQSTRKEGNQSPKEEGNQSSREEGN
ncbi:retinitis pigmentosa 1-like 1 protein isoform X1 [Agelaius tricolor]|uniref:retinitis pigmentosa 1-like 1 protein isoform X1 n=1 Tax=Agelaius tricolor TaxID=9191 RepID=UPI0039F1D7D9